MSPVKSIANAYPIANDSSNYHVRALRTVDPIFVNCVCVCVSWYIQIVIFTFELKSKWKRVKTQPRFHWIFTNAQIIGTSTILHINHLFTLFHIGFIEHLTSKFIMCVAKTVHRARLFYYFFFFISFRFAFTFMFILSCHILCLVIVVAIITKFSFITKCKCLQYLLFRSKSGLSYSFEFGVQIVWLIKYQWLLRILVTKTTDKIANEPELKLFLFGKTVHNFPLCLFVCVFPFNI